MPCKMSVALSSCGWQVELKTIWRSKLLHYGLSVMAILLAAMALGSLGDHVNSTTVALTMLLLILTLATFFGRNPALLGSFIAMLCFNYFFLPPYHTWRIAEPQNLIAWAAFTATAIVAGELSAYARRRAREAERLYAQLETAFEAATQAKALKQSEKLKSALLDAVTHDLRTPLTSIKASVTTLLESEGGHRTIELDSEGRTEFLNIINEETDRLNGFIESMVGLARLESGPRTADRALASIEEIISTALQRAEKVLAEHELNLNIRPKMPRIHVDPAAIAEVIYILLENAAKYSPAKTPITVDAFADRDGVNITITDRGKGIPAEMRQRVFEKFVRLEGDRADGLGLGLAIARGIVEAQNGTIEIVTPPHAIGTKIVVRFPLGVYE